MNIVSSGSVAKISLSRFLSQIEVHERIYKIY